MCALIPNALPSLGLQHIDTMLPCHDTKTPSSHLLLPQQHSPTKVNYGNRQALSAPIIPHHAPSHMTAKRHLFSASAPKRTVQQNSSSEPKRDELHNISNMGNYGNYVDKQLLIDEIHPREHIIKNPIVEPLLSATSALSALFPHYPPSALRHFALLEENFAPLSQFYE